MVGKPSFSHQLLYKCTDGFVSIYSFFRWEREVTFYFKFWYILNNFKDLRSELNRPQFPFIPSVDACVHSLVFWWFCSSAFCWHVETLKEFFFNSSTLFLLVMNLLHKVRSNPAEFMPSDTTALCHQRWMTGQPHTSPKRSSESDLMRNWGEK